jgi:four helix bundle protein
MKEPRPHEKLDVWKRAIDLCVDMYQATEKLPPDEKYGLVSQMRRAAVSVGSNIAEGAAGGSIALYVRSLRIARASLAELDTQLEICRRLTFITDYESEQLGEQTEIIGKMLTNLIKALKRK